MKSMFEKIFNVLVIPFLLIKGISEDIGKLIYKGLRECAVYTYESCDLCVKNIILFFRDAKWKIDYYFRNKNKSRAFKPIIILASISGVVFFLFFSLSFYLFVVPAGDSAVITRFGKVNRIMESGLAFRFPLFERYYIVGNETIREERFGFRQGPNTQAKLRQLTNPQENYIKNVYEKDVLRSERSTQGMFARKGNLYAEVTRKQRMTHDYLRQEYAPPISKTVLDIKKRIELRKIIEEKARRSGVRPDGKIPVERERRLLTGDMSIVLLEWTIQYYISDVKDYLFNSRDVQQNIRDISLAVMNEVIGEYRLEEVITNGRQKIELTVQERVQTILDEYDVGIKVTQVIILNALPPKTVEFAFDEVNKAAQDMENLKYQAEIEYLKIIPEAEGKAARIIKQAEAYATDIVNKAIGEAGQFSRINVEYLKAPKITEDRIYIETMEKIFKNTPNIIMDKNVRGILPIIMGNRNEKKHAGKLLDKELEKLMQSSASFKEKMKKLVDSPIDNYSVVPERNMIKPNSLRRAIAQPFSSVRVNNNRFNQQARTDPPLPRQAQVATQPPVEMQQRSGQAPTLSGTQQNNAVQQRNTRIRAQQQGGNANAMVP